MSAPAPAAAAPAAPAAAADVTAALAVVKAVTLAAVADALAEKSMTTAGVIAKLKKSHAHLPLASSEVNTLLYKHPDRFLKVAPSEGLAPLWKLVEKARAPRVEARAADGRLVFAVDWPEDSPAATADSETRKAISALLDTAGKVLGLTIKTAEINAP